MDCLRCAKRLGAEHVIFVYRRTRNELPARKEELEHAEEEFIDFRWLSAPLEIYGNDEGFVTGMKIQRMELGEPDASGRRRPVPVAGLGVRHRGRHGDRRHRPEPEPAGDPGDARASSSTGTGASSSTRQTMMSKSLPGVFAGGDIVTGAATVILAMGAGKVGRPRHPRLARQARARRGDEADVHRRAGVNVGE